MKKKMVALLAGAMLIMASGIASAYTFDFASTNGNGGYTSAVAGATVETFDPNASTTQGWTWAGDYIIVSNGGNLGGKYSAPAFNGVKETTDYVSVPEDLTNGSTVLVTNIGGLRNYFGLWWGSMDTYNTLSFYKGTNTTPVATITGSDVAVGTANGEQYNVDTNNYVNFYFGANETFDSFRMTSTSYAFEADNIAVGNIPVPEPGTMLLLGLGLMGVAGIRRFKK